MQRSLLCCELSLHCSNSRAVDPPVLSCMLLDLWTTLKQALMGGFPIKTTSRVLHMKWILVHSQLTGAGGIPLLGDVPCFQQAPCSGSSSARFQSSFQHRQLPVPCHICPRQQSSGNMSLCSPNPAKIDFFFFFLLLAVFLGVSPVI